MSSSTYGSLFIFGFPGHSVTSQVRQFIIQFKPRGFIFFKDNLDSRGQISQMLKDIQTVYADMRLPNPLLSIDYEGGDVDRLSHIFPKIPPANQLGQNLTEQTGYELGVQMASQLKQLGFNLNFAPVCDISSPTTPDYLSHRIFSSNVTTVSTLVNAFIKGHQSQSVMACAKHFPGLGSSNNDPHHVAITSLDHSNRFQAHHWRPFQSSIQAKVSSIMTSHILCPQLDSETIATFSRTIVHTTLRDHLNFSGLIISDDLNMGAIQIPLVEASLKSLDAGHDLVIVSNRQIDAHITLLKELEKTRPSKAQT